MLQDTYVLREDQSTVVDQIPDLFREQPSLLIAAPTGWGKTIIISEIVARTIQRGHRAALLVHRQELVKQSEEKITIQTQRPPGIVWQSKREWDEPCTIIAQDTISAIDIPNLPPLDILIIDEAHHTVAPGWLRTLQRLNPKFLLGMSATPFRQDKEPLHPTPFAKILRPITPQELIDRNILCPAVIESPIIHDSNGQRQPINQANNIESIYYDAVRYAIADGRTKILLYVSQTQHHTPLQVIQKTTNLLRQQGIPANAISQNISSKQRESAILHFRASPGVSVLVNYMALTEGTDLPYVDCVIIGRHTASESTIIQMIGRGLRLHPRKSNCLVLEYTGRPDMNEIIHYWRLDEPKEDGAYAPKQIEPKLTKPQLFDLVANFRSTISPIGATRVTYPWFQPFDKRPLLALPLGPTNDGEARYLTVEPTKSNAWKISNVVLKQSGPAQLWRKQILTQSSNEAANMVRASLGNKANLLQRNAPWRLKPASEAQAKTWLSLHPEAELFMTNNLTAGEASDAIAQTRFRNRVAQETL